MSVFQDTSDPIQTQESVAETLPPRVLTLDVARYEAMLDDPGLSEEQRREFLETLWSIIVSFVDLGYGIHPLQQSASGGVDGIDAKLALESSNLVSLPQVDSPKSKTDGTARSFSDAVGKKES